MASPQQTEASPSPTRRRFLAWVTGIGALGSAALAGIPALRAFVSPIFKRPAAGTWIKLGEADLFDPDVPTKVDFSETTTDAWVETRELRSVWVYTTDGEHFTVYSGRCTHLGCSFAYDKDRKSFRCPCHQGMFDPKTGAVLAGPPPRPLDQLETKIEKGDLYVAYRDFRVGTPQKVAV
jgi:menaquinol-cytochrome c reductase iron-sulfur subunit